MPRCGQSLHLYALFITDQYQEKYWAGYIGRYMLLLQDKSSNLAVHRNPLSSISIRPYCRFMYCTPLSGISIRPYCRFMYSMFVCYNYVVIRHNRLHIPESMLYSCSANFRIYRGFALDKKK